MVNVFIIFLIVTSLPYSLLDAATFESLNETLGATRIARWEGDRQAAFLLMFDDSCTSDITHVVPGLEANHLIATFYVNPGSGQWAGNRQAWEVDLPQTGMEYGNHTMTHKGFHNDAEAEREIGGCSDVINKLFPHTNLVSWGQPGGIAPENWPMSDQQLTALLASKHLIPRPDFGGRGAMIHLSTADAMMGQVDKALKSGGVEAVIFHGVGDDWIVTPLPIFTEFITKLVARRDQVWITGHITSHKYASERDSATVTVKATSAATITLDLACTTDAALYDYPLTLITTVPATWKRCTVIQGATSTIVTVADGHAHYAALPAGGQITLTNAP